MRHWHATRDTTNDTTHAPHTHTHYLLCAREGRLVGLDVFTAPLAREHLDVAGHLLPRSRLARAHLDVTRDELVAS